MLMQGTDFSAEFIHFPLSLAVHFKLESTGEKFVFTHVTLKRMYNPDMARFHAQAARIPRNNESFNVMLGNLIMEHSIHSFHTSEGGEEFSKASNLLIIPYVHPVNSVKIMYWWSMLQKGTSLLTTAYKCGACGRGNINSLDPAHPVPDDMLKHEPERGYMQDFLDFIEKQSCHTKELFHYKLKHPYWIKGPHDPEPVEETEDDITQQALAQAQAQAKSKKGSAKQAGQQKETIESMRKKGMILLTDIHSKYIMSGSIVNALNDKKRQDDPSGWARYDAIVSVNDFSEEDTKLIKDRNRFEGFFEKFRQEDANGFDAEDQKYQLKIKEHTFNCRLCQAKNTDIFDTTNFFASLKI